MGLELAPKDGDTQLSEEELAQLIPQHVTTREQLDEVEQDHIEDAYEWLLRTNLSIDKILTRGFCDQLHSKMFDKVWLWAGNLRTRETNIGIAPHLIQTQRQQLLDDVKFWIANDTFTPVETGLRFHHKLVKIHCYLNGNGRHSRILADIILDVQWDLPAIKWKGEDFINPNEFRENYIAALRSADNEDYDPLKNCIEK